MSDSDPSNDDTGADAAASAPDSFKRQGPPVFRIEIRPYRSIGKRGVSVVMLLAALGLAVPLIGLTGTRAAWGMLPFLLAVLGALYWAMRRSHFDAGLYEILELWPDQITVVRHEPRGRIQHWHANPFWVKVTLHENARIEKYLTLQGNNREIELGAFLAPWEREQLYSDLCDALARIKHAS